VPLARAYAGTQMSSFSSSRMPDPGEHGLSTTDARILAVKRRLLREASTAVSMLERALISLWDLDVAAGKAVRMADDGIDEEEVRIEQECHEILTLHHPYARDFRNISFILKVNADVERIADHSCSIAKIVGRIANADPNPPAWPMALTELGVRVPTMCHQVLRAVLDDDTELARQVVASDEIIDQLDRRLFEEVLEMLRARDSDQSRAVAMYIYRVGRELERVGDLSAGIAEDLIYLCTGVIVRHTKKRNRKGT